MRILITNDDGLNSSGMLEAERALSALGEVWAVAPDRERSATSMGISLREPLRVISESPRRFMVTGFPVDCVNVCLFAEGFPRFDLVVSGINHGFNLGDDVHYSGTVGAARHAALHGHRAVAISAPAQLEGVGYRRPARWLCEWLGAFSAQLAPRVVYNINFPPEPNVPAEADDALPSWELTRQGRRIYSDRYQEIERGEHYSMIRLAESELGRHPDPGTDFDAIERGFVSVTPLELDQTDYEEQRRWQANLRQRVKN